MLTGTCISSHYTWYMKQPQYLNKFCAHIIQIYSGITSGRVLDGELLYTKILEVNLFAYAYRLLHEDFSPKPSRLEITFHEKVCRHMQIN